MRYHVTYEVWDDDVLSWVEEFKTFDNRADACDFVTELLEIEDNSDDQHFLRMDQY